MKSVVIFGAGWHGRCILDILRAQGRDVAGFLNDKIMYGARVDGVPILGDTTRLSLHSFLSDYDLIIGIGDPQTRLRLAKTATNHGGRFATAIHPAAIIHGNTDIEAGSVVFPGAIVSVGVRIEKHCIINNGVTLGHDSRVLEGASVNDGCHLAGGVIVEAGAYLGIGVNVIPRLRIGARAIVGAGSTVIKDVPPDVTVAGCPARIIRDRRAGDETDEHCTAYIPSA